MPRILTFAFTLAIALVACEGVRPLAELGTARQAITCGGTNCGATPSFCGESAVSCNGSGSAALCCDCNKTFACGSDCAACPATPANATVASCAGFATPAATACLLSCTAGFLNTNGIATDGCEVACSVPATCGNDCGACPARANATLTCSGNGVPAATACGFTCTAGFLNTNGLASDGCEVACSIPATCGNDCGACAAPPANAVATCSGNSAPAATACGFACSPGFLNTNSLAADGCEVACSVPATCGNDCGACLASPANATSTCAGNATPAATSCGLSCSPGFLNTNGTIADGCEATCNTPATCGNDCGVCAAAPANATATCAGNSTPAATSCGFTCNPGFLNVNGLAADGCEVACSVPATCGNDCGACAAAPANAVAACAGNSTPAATACGFACNPGFLNTNGLAADGCEVTCSVPTTCGSNCGACLASPANATSTCAGNATPAATSCGLLCNAGFLNTNGTVADGCEAACSVPATCGNDCAPCPARPNASLTCSGNTNPAATACGFTCSAGFRDVNTTAADGCEVTCNSSTLCGTDCAACPARANASLTCSGNTVLSTTACGFTCLPGYRNANGTAPDGCEQACTVVANCGTDCAACPARANAARVCLNNTSLAATACTFTCNAGFYDADATATNGCEATCTVIASCGSDCQACPARANATATCSGSVQPAATSCVYTCASGYRNANGNWADGCEQACTVGAACGSNCLACATTNASSATCLNNTSLAATACNPACNSGFVNRDGNAANGCESCTLVTACGTDCATCAATNTSSLTCSNNTQASASACQPVCTSGFANADSNNQNGCEATCNTATQCGSNCLACAMTNAGSTTCQNNTSLAAVACNPVCNSGFRNQDANAANGCEACTVSTSCGTDCLACAATHTTGVPPCNNNTQAAAAACRPVCTSGFANADGDNQNGCEATCNNLTRCGTDCLPCSVVNAGSTTCQNNTSAAATACIPVCSPGYKNQDGSGANGCEACGGLTACGTDCLACANTNTTSTTCQNNTSAAATSCQPSCSAGWLNLDANGTNGCEARCDQTSRCGTDCVACAATNTSSVTCNNNTQTGALACRPTCSSGFANVDGNNANGCEARCDQNARCGSNCLACGTTNASVTSCSGNTLSAAASCKPTCLPGFADLDGDGSNGCEASCTTTATCGTDCGACANTNATSVSCVNNTVPAATACRPTCAAGWANLDGNNQNGCEARCDVTGRCGTNCLACANTNASSTSCSGNTLAAAQSCKPICLPGLSDLDGDGSNGCEAACMASTQCGSNCAACATTNTSSVSCANNTQPAVDACRPVCSGGWQNLDSNNQNGCEARCDVTGRCGTNCLACAATHTTATGCQGNATSASQACLPTCAAGYGNLDADNQNGCEATCDSAAHCGSDCGACASTNASSTTCSGNTGLARAACRPTCSPGFRNLDSDNQNACEARCDQNSRCGADCAVCATTNTASTSCLGNASSSAASCKPVCLLGFKDADLDGANGCEVTCSVASACGTDCLACSPTNTSALACSGNDNPATQNCRPTCAAGFQNLDLNNLNGCEARCDQNSRCGSDCRACANTNALTVSCSGNAELAATACRPICGPGWKDADGDSANGCEAPCDNTGRCGLDCKPCEATHTSATACSGQLQFAAKACKPTCAAGWSDSDADGANGCEYGCDQPGRCGTDCRACSLQNADSATCSGAGFPAIQSCKPACKPGFATLDADGANGCEVRCDSTNHCGTDCLACAATHASVTVCSGNDKLSTITCRPTCDPGYHNADADGATGCEASCGDDQSCGLECAACSRANASTATCTGNTTAASAACVPTCQPGHQNPDGDGLNGCEATCDTPDRCGTTCLACPTPPNSTISCSGPTKEPAEACGFSCAPGFVDKDPFQDGCEAPCDQPDRCGSDCGSCPAAPNGALACAGNKLASAEGCSFTCKDGYVDLNAKPSDGCEACADGFYVSSTTGPVCDTCTIDEHCGVKGASAAFCQDCTSLTREGRVCVFGRCGCNAPSDCPSGYECKSHSCWKACANDGECGNDERCCGAAGAKTCLVWADEVCDGMDNDCNGKVDDGLKVTDAPECEKQLGVCKGSRATCVGGVIEPCAAATYAAFSADYEAVESRCDGKDNDCNGKTDEPASCATGSDAGPITRPDASGGFNGETYDLGGCGCQQAAAPGTAAALVLLLSALRRRRSKRG